RPERGQSQKRASRPLAGRRGIRRQARPAQPTTTTPLSLRPRLHGRRAHSRLLPPPHPTTPHPHLGAAAPTVSNPHANGNRAGELNPVPLFGFGQRASGVRPAGHWFVLARSIRKWRIV